MCNAVRGALLCLALGAALCAPAAAQDLAAVRQRIARLSRAYDAAAASAAQREEAVRRGAQVDTVDVGPLRIFTRPPASPDIVPAAESAVRVLRRTFGGIAARVPEHSIAVEFYAGDDQIPLGQSVTYISLPRNSGRPVFTSLLIWTGAQAISEAEDTVLRTWHRHAVPLPGARTAGALTPVYVELVTSPWSKARACYVGDLAACRAALGLAGADDPVGQRYDSLDRRRLARSLFEERANADEHVQRCLRAGVDADCAAGLRALAPASLTPPLGAGARLSLLQLALRSGGPAAYERLRADPSRSLEQRLAAAAQLPPDELIARWRAAVLAARPETLAVAARPAWAALLWAVLFGLLALRSTRWR